MLYKEFIINRELEGGLRMHVLRSCQLSCFPLAHILRQFTHLIRKSNILSLITSLDHLLVIFVILTGISSFSLLTRNSKYGRLLVGYLWTAKWR